MCRCLACNRTAVALVATGLRRVALKHHVESGLSVVVEWRFHSRQAGTTRKASNPQTGGRRPKKRLLRQVSAPGARGAVADGPSRYWCTYQRRCGNAGPMVLTQGGHPPRATVPRNGGLEGTNPRTGRQYFLNNVGYREFLLDFGGYVSEVARCSGTLVWGLVCRSWFSSAIPFTVSLHSLTF